VIIQVRGTSGSGKSTIVRELLKVPGWDKLRVKKPGRKQPYGYMLTRPDQGIVCVPGHYESACGGCDTLPGQDITFQAVREAADVALHTVFEGLLASEEVRRTVELHNDYKDQLLVILLTTPVEECLEGIRARRVARGDARPLKEGNTRNRVGVIERACKRLDEAGVQVIRASRSDAWGIVYSAVTA
jgi:hypothetical protein